MMSHAMWFEYTRISNFVYRKFMVTELQWLTLVTGYKNHSSLHTFCRKAQKGNSWEPHTTTPHSRMSSDYPMWQANHKKQMIWIMPISSKWDAWQMSTNCHALVIRINFMKIAWASALSREGLLLECSVGNQSGEDARMTTFGLCINCTHKCHIDHQHMISV